MALLGGFQFQEKMSGTYTLRGGPEGARRITFKGRVRAADALAHLRDGMAELEGTVDLEGFADDVPMAGTIQISPLRKRLIRYEFSFVANDGRPYRFAGQKDIRFGDLLGSWTTLPAALYDQAGQEVGQARVTFDMKSDFLPLLVSFRRAC
jgi:hypothetical protein